MGNVSERVALTDLKRTKFEMVKDDIKEIPGQQLKNKVILPKTLTRIRALKDLKGENGFLIKAGDLGGYIESETNLSHFGTSWVHPDAVVYGNSEVKDDAQLMDSSILRYKSTLKDKAIVDGASIVQSSSIVMGTAQVRNSVLNGNVVVGAKAVISNTPQVLKNTRIFGCSFIKKVNHAMFFELPVPMTFTVTIHDEIQTAITVNEKPYIFVGTKDERMIDQLFPKQEHKDIFMLNYHFFEELVSMSV
jgi:carbonic anhydrase/acetyltransferase-like protein (isoleucine patch superfamily)